MGLVYGIHKGTAARIYLNHKPGKLIAACLAGLLVLTSSAAFSATPDKEMTKLLVLPETWDSLRLGYEPIKALGILSTYKKSTDHVISLGPHDVENCSADRRTLILTPEATQRLARVYAPDEHKSLGFKLETSHQAYVLVGSRGVFAGGIFLTEVSPMAIRFESISAEMRGERLQLMRNSNDRGESKPLPWPGGTMKCSQ